MKIDIKLLKATPNNAEMFAKNVMISIMRVNEQLFPSGQTYWVFLAIFV